MAEPRFWEVLEAVFALDRWGPPHQAKQQHLQAQLAARAAGYADLVAPPMFAVVYSSPAVTVAMFDPELGVDFARVVHGAQELVWGPLVIAGDEVMTTVTVKDLSQRGGMTFYVFEAESENQRGETVCTGTWTIIVRGAS